MTGLIFDAADELVALANAGEVELDTIMPGRGLVGIHPDRLGYRPLSYAEMAASLRTEPPDMALVMVGPTSDPSTVSFGVQHGYIDDLLHAEVPMLAVFNDALPHIFGAPTVDRRDVEIVASVGRPPARVSMRADDTCHRIAEFVAGLIPDGATIELGLGSITAAVTPALRLHRELRVVTGLVDSSVLALGPALDRRSDTPPVTTTVLAGGTDLVRSASDDGLVRLAPASEVHDPTHLRRLDQFVAVNGAVSVALDGSVNCERVNGRLVSGRGGHTDYCRAAHECPDGISIVALPSRTSRGRPRIVAEHEPGHVSTPGELVDVVVTEWGVADLRGVDEGMRRQRIAEIAHPDDRPALLRAASSG